MNRTDRLLAIVLELQGRGWQRAEDLADTFETSKRTIYRDMLALGEAGVPVVSIPGRGYSLVEGYFLPPLTFTTDEATMVLLGSDLMAKSFDVQYRAAAESAGRKIAGVLPERLREDVRTLRERFSFVHPDISTTPDMPQRLLVLRSAMLESHAVRFRYFARSHTDGAQTPTTRTVYPYLLAHMRSVWYLTAWDTTRRDLRRFRLERIEDLAILDETFARPDNFRMGRSELAASEIIVVRVLLDHEVARWAQEEPSYFRVAQETTADGLLVTLHVRDTNDILQWLLGWGSHLRVLEPERLRQRIATEAEAMLRHHRLS
ncbi:MAG TPA: YafY family protein [Ktedonobacterales bacterium]|nr:YafY family protein [Ktedonobacterales bacterium]